MAVELVDLVPRLEAALTVPGSTGLFTFSDATTDGWRLALANAFWNARLAGLFTDYRVDADGEEVSHISGGVDLPEEVHQVLVEQAALTAIEMRFASLANTKAKSGSQEFEQSRSATLLKGLLDARRASLEAIKKDLVDGAIDGSAASTVAFIDLAVVRHEQISYGQGYWVN